MTNPVNISEITQGPFELEFTKQHILPDEIIVTDDHETYFIARTQHLIDLQALGYVRIDLGKV
ncbi:hypothetical protein [Rossellomorea aquimaris]|uniref:hypothetical protein n=1 Tax=Rossellomorea aquimaris TaxID=189382 RepID=UPI001CFCBA17|nr:hypothetical protein [Rossellomorea aquimaris]